MDETNQGGDGPVLTNPSKFIGVVKVTADVFEDYIKVTWERPEMTVKMELAVILAVAGSCSEKVLKASSPKKILPS